MDPREAELPLSGVRERELQMSLAKIIRSSWIGPRILATMLSSSGTVMPEGISAVQCDVNVRDSALGLETDSDRETDLIARFNIAVHGNERRSVILLIEVKVVAPFSHGQVTAYGQRAGLLTSEADQVTTGLIAPQAHLLKAEASAFSTWLSLEQIQSLMTEHCKTAPDSHRLDFETDVIRRAIAAAGTGYPLLVSLARQEQYAYYDTFVSEYQPKLRVRETSAGVRSLDRFFDTPLRIGTIKHRVEEGLVVIEFLGRRSPPDAVRTAAYIDDLTIDTVGSTSCQIRQRSTVPGLEMDQSFDAQSDALQQALDQVAGLHDWIERNQAAFNGWAD